ncbi:hypothetical protein D3C85_933920 [compost metagenome]
MASSPFFSRFNSTCSIRMGSASTSGAFDGTKLSMRMRRLRASISAKPMALSTMRPMATRWRRGSLRFTNSRMRLMILPARSACEAAFSSAGSSMLGLVWPALTKATAPML